MADTVVQIYSTAGNVVQIYSTASTVVQIYSMKSTVVQKYSTESKVVQIYILWKVGSSDIHIQYTVGYCSSDILYCKESNLYMYSTEGTILTVHMNMQFSYTVFIESKDLRSLNIFTGS